MPARSRGWNDMTDYANDGQITKIEIVAPNGGRNGFATTAMVLGIVSLVLSFIPIIGMIAWITGPLAIIFALLSRKSAKRGQSTAGLITGILAMIMCVLWVAAFSKAANDVNDSINTYTACTDAAKANYPGSDLDSLNLYFSALSKC